MENERIPKINIFLKNVYVSKDNDHTTKLDPTSAINFAISSGDLSELKSLVPIWKIK